jgi:pimeloyl-[acyl-carrier protein] methyl ester esterase
MTIYTQTNGDGPDVVLIHGWGLNGGIWETLAPWLEQSGFRVMRVDLPGYGRSAWQGEADVGAQARAVLEGAPQRAAWLGWSMGALVALRAALDAPARIARLVLVAGTPSFICRPGWRAAMEPGLLESFARDLQRDYLRTLRRFLTLQARGSDAAETVLRELRARLLQHGHPVPAALLGGLDILRDTDLRAQLPRIACPALWLMGARDTLVPVAAGRQAAACMPDARVEVVPGAGHAPFLTRPADISGVITDFLRPLHAGRAGVTNAG